MHYRAPVGLEHAAPAPGVLATLTEADLVILPPSNPVVSVDTILAVPDIREALRATAAPVVGVSPIIDGTAVRGMADTPTSVPLWMRDVRSTARIAADTLDLGRSVRS